MTRAVIPDNHDLDCEWRQRYMDAAEMIGMLVEDAGGEVTLSHYAQLSYDKNLFISEDPLSMHTKLTVKPKYGREMSS
jgi:hypothetical protein